MGQYKFGQVSMLPSEFQIYFYSLENLWRIVWVEITLVSLVGMLRVSLNHFIDKFINEWKHKLIRQSQHKNNLKVDIRKLVLLHLTEVTYLREQL